MKINPYALCLWICLNTQRKGVYFISHSLEMNDLIGVKDLRSTGTHFYQSVKVAGIV